MTIDGLIVLFLAVGLVIFVGTPFVQQRSDHGVESETTLELEQLSLQKETIYTAIRDLDFDFQTGKVDTNDYGELRRHLEEEAVQLLRRIDEVDPLAGLDDEIERQILALRNQQQASNPGLTPGDACPGCEITLQGGESFCPSCGQPLMPA